MCPNIEVEIGMTDKSPFLYKTISCQGREKKHLGQGNEETVFLRDTKGRFFCLFQPGHANQEKINKGQESGHRLQAFKYVNCKT